MRLLGVFTYIDCAVPLSYLAPFWFEGRTLSEVSIITQLAHGTSETRALEIQRSGFIPSCLGLDDLELAGNQHRCFYGSGVYFFVGAESRKCAAEYRKGDEPWYVISAYATVSEADCLDFGNREHERIVSYFYELLKERTLDERKVTIAAACNVFCRENNLRAVLGPPKACREVAIRFVEDIYVDKIELWG